LIFFQTYKINTMHGKTEKREGTFNLIISLK